MAVVVVGEAPYAEFEGDRTDLALTPADLAAIRAVRQAGVPAVVVLLSGRPLIVNEALDMSDAFVAAWLPFGDYAPTGKLPVSWPRASQQLPLNVGDATYDPLFPYGFGLSYAR